MTRRRFSPLILLLAAACGVPQAAAPSEAPTDIPIPTATRTSPPVPTIRPTATGPSREYMEQLDAIYTMVVVIEGNATLVAETASRVASGSVDEVASEAMLADVERVMTQVDGISSTLQVPSEFSESWEEALGVHAQTREILAAWRAGTIDPGEAALELEEVRASADHASRLAETRIAPLIGSTQAEMESARGLFLAGAIADAFEEPVPVYACGEGESAEAGAGLTGRIAFTSVRDGDPEIYVINADGSGATRLTDSPGGDYHPSWSPDGRRIAFYSEREGNAEIYVMNDDGTQVTRLTNDAAQDYDPAWSPDGTQIAFHSHRYQGAGRIYVMNADGSDVHRLTDPAFDDWSPSWSSDGAQIVFNSSRSDDRDIWVINSDGTGLLDLTDSPVGDDWWPDWSPSGNRIVFHSARDGHFEIYTMDASGEDVIRLTNSLAGGYDPAWSGDGTHIVFTSDGAGNRELCAMRSDGSGLFNVTNNPAHDWGADWGP